MRTRSLVARGLVAAIYLALAVFSFVYGRSHRIFVENPGETPLSFSVDGQKPVTVRAGGRRFQEAKGPSHRILLEFQDGRASLEAPFRVSAFADGLLFSAPGDASGALSPPAIVPADTEER